MSTGAPDRSAFDPIDFLERAVATPSHENVEEMHNLVVETLATYGVDSRVDDAGNLIASRGTATDAGSADDSRVAGRSESSTKPPHLLFNTHLDTVTPHVPLGWRDDGERLCGRGSCDAKGPLAAMLAAFLRTDPGAGRLTLALTPDEERLSTGAHALVTDHSSPIHVADGVIVGEPTGLDVCTAAKGRFEGTITLTGANAHAAEPDSGRNAVAALEGVLRALRTFGEAPGTPDRHSELGAPTLTPTVVAGGEATNQVPADCRLTVDRRSVPPETAQDFRDALLAHLHEQLTAPVDVDFEFTDRPTPFLEAWATDADELLVSTLADHAGGDVRPFTAATEAAYFAARVPTVVFGPGVLADDDGAVAHADREYVTVESVERAATALEGTARAFVHPAG
ncbi:M20 family metallopeptidase [Halovivax sp.]|uniref:M20 family metallopeptidase n=1 Tax=Halovivax sp. TaxID=1935978 RepID=UPI0025C322D6|nr:M20 family metallopeptidase [Halovivax sp.]